MSEKLKFFPSNALTSIDFPPELGIIKLQSGKVRDIFELPDGNMMLVSTDRLSAFDRQVGLIPDRGHTLTRISQWFFERTKDIVPNHLLAVPDPNVMLVRKLPTIPLEMVVRGFLTGSTETAIWTRYQKGQRIFGGVTLYGGMKKGDPLPRPIVDPTSKAVVGHDKNLTCEEIVDSGIMTREHYEELEAITLALFAREQALYKEGGLTMVDTKYEFGIDPETGEFVLIDENGTPDSSRLVDDKGEHFDKEYIRLWFAEQGYHGEGDPPPIPQEIIDEARSRYITVYEKLWGNKFIVPWGDPNQRIIKNVGYCLKKFNGGKK